MASVLSLKTDIRKLKAAIASKATSGAIKTKLRGKLTNLENQLDKLQPNKRKPKTTGPKNESALVRLAKKRRTSQGLSLSKSDIERDAIRPAKAAGRRISANGNRYYEYRDNRVDNRQLPRKYRKLADGGKVDDDYRGGLAEHIYKTSVGKDIHGYKLVKGSWGNEGTLHWRNDDNDKIDVYATPFFTPDNDINFEKYYQDTLIDKEDKAYKLTGDLDKDTEKYFDYLDKKIKEFEYKKEVISGYTDEKLARIYSKLNDLDYNDVLIELKGSAAERKDIVNNIFNEVVSREKDNYADGGHMADGGEVEISEIPRRIKYLDYDGGPNDKRLHYQESRTFGAENKEDYEDATEQIDKIEYEGNGWKLFVVYDTSGYQYWMKSQEEQNYMQITIAFDEYTIDKAEVPKIEAALMEAVNDIEDIAYRYDYIPSDDNYKKGGYMAKGGKTKDQEVVRGYFEDEAYEYGKGGNLNVPYVVYDEEEMKVLKEFKNFTSAKKFANDYLDKHENKIGSVTSMPKSYYEKNKMLYPTKEYGGYMADGGSVSEGNYQMLLSQAKEAMHHAKELISVVKPNMDIEAWVVAKAERATTDLSDITHYLDGLKMAMGGMVKHNEHKVNA